MEAAHQFQLTIAALICSVAALFFSLLAAFPGFKVVLAAVRDGVLWVALFLVLGAGAFVVWQQLDGQAQAVRLTKKPLTSLEPHAEVAAPRPKSP